MKHKLTLVNILCIVLIVVGFFAVVFDFAILFGGSMGIQYAVNLSYFIACPVLLGGAGMFTFNEKGGHDEL